MGKPRKAGPKSFHEQQKKRIFDLGDSSVDDEEEAPEEATATGVFESPTGEEGLTDYGLDFTSSRLTRENPRRCSTLTTAKEKQPKVTSRKASLRSQSEQVIEELHTLASRKSAVRSQLQRQAQDIGTSPPRQATLMSRSPRAGHEQNVSSPQRSSVRRPLSEVASNEQAQPVPQRKQQTQQNRTKSQPRGASKRKPQAPTALAQRFWKEVMKLQATGNFLIPRAPFGRLVREAIIKESPVITMITRPALEALQEATEMYMTQRLQDAYLLTLHRGRITLTVRDLQLISFLRTNGNN